MLLVGIAMLSCLPVCWFYGESIWRSFAWSALLTLAVALMAVCYGERPEEGFSYKEGFVLVSLGWLLVSLFGTLPYIFAGATDSVADAVFEAFSGFTTTGASIYRDVESLPRGILFWRAMSHWLGGMGIIALFVAIMANAGARANQIFRVEVPGPPIDKISPRIQDNAKLLWGTYIALTVILFLLLWAAGMGGFDAVCHAFSTVSTGGFSNHNASLAGYSAVVQWLVIMFMFLAGVNFSLHYLFVTRRQLSLYYKNEEFRLYIILIVAALILCAGSLFYNQGGAQAATTIRQALFAVLAVMTTTGFYSSDYTGWPLLGQFILFALLFVGACAGSTSGNMKVGRYLIMFKRGLVELLQMVHPRSVHTVKVNGHALSEALVVHVLQFFFLYILLLITVGLVLTAEGLDLFSSLTGAAATLGNVGPAFGLLGPTGNYAFLSDAGKYILSFAMLVGRLEIYPVLLLLIPSFWRQ